MDSSWSPLVGFSKNSYVITTYVTQDSIIPRQRQWCPRNRGLWYVLFSHRNNATPWHQVIHRGKNEKHHHLLNGCYGPDIVVHYLPSLQEPCKGGIISPVLKIRELSFRAAKCLTWGLTSESLIVSCVSQCLNNLACEPRYKSKHPQ